MSKLANIIKKHNIREWTTERKTNYWRNFINTHQSNFQDYLNELDEVSDKKYRLNLGYNRKFWHNSGLDYCNPDYDAVREGIAFYLLEKEL